MARILVLAGLLICAYVANGSPVDDDPATKATTFRDDYQYYQEVNGWVKLHKFPTFWPDARLACYLEGARLASPVNDGLMSVMERLVKEANKTAYTGVFSKASVEDYMSLNGIPLKKMPIKWAEGQPDNKDNNERCLALTPQGMEDLECNAVRPFICYKKDEGESFAMKECGTSDLKYVKDKSTGSCYKVHSTPTSWYRAHTVCTAEGGHLAIFNSEAEAQAVAAMAANSPHDKEMTLEVHIGFYLWPNGQYTYPERRPIFYSTVDDKTLEEAGYAHWAPNLPPSVDDGDMCGTFRLKKNKLQGLCHGYCYDSRPFVCEIDEPVSK